MASTMELTVFLKNVRSNGNVWNQSNKSKNSTFWVFCNKLMFKYILHNMFLFEKYKLIQT